MLHNIFEETGFYEVNGRDNWPYIKSSFIYSYQSTEGLVIISSGKESSFITGLPQGNQSENYVVKLQALISDSLGDAYTVQVIVQVKIECH